MLRFLSSNKFSYIAPRINDLMSVSNEACLSSWNMPKTFASSSYQFEIAVNNVL